MVNTPEVVAGRRIQVMHLFQLLDEWKELAEMDEKKLSRFFRGLDRTLFLDEPYKEYAWLDSPLPIGFDQTISQPTLVLEMTRLLAPEPDSRVLEIGTGSGYQTAFLAEFSGRVHTVEVIPELAEKAEERLTELGYRNVFFRTGDGSSGWAEKAPFDRIIVTAAAGTKPHGLIDQLAPGGRMVIPVGPPFVQELLLITKDEEGKVHEENRGQVRFVELVGRYGWSGQRK